MTSNDFPQTLSARIVETAKIASALSVIFAAIFGMWSWAWGPVGRFVAKVDALTFSMQSVLTDMQSLEENSAKVDTLLVTVDTLSMYVRQLQNDVARANGDNRVIRQTPGLSYVEEPVYQGDPIVLILVAQRTVLGKDCRLIDWIPLFTDGRRIAIPGGPALAGPPRRQISGEETLLRLEILPPKSLEPGRVDVYLTLTYNCNGTTIYDRTDPVIFELLPKNQPPVQGGAQ